MMNGMLLAAAALARMRSAIGAEQGRETGGRDAEWTRVAMVEQRGGLVAPGDVDQVARDQPMPREAGLVGLQTVFVLDAALDEVESDPWQPPLGEPPEIVDIHRVSVYFFMAMLNHNPLQLGLANSSRRLNQLSTSGEMSLKKS